MKLPDKITIPTELLDARKCRAFAKTKEGERQTRAFAEQMEFFAIHCDENAALARKAAKLARTALGEAK